MNWKLTANSASLTDAFPWYALRIAVPGTTMTYAGVSDPKERADLIAYLKRQSACQAAR